MEPYDGEYQEGGAFCPRCGNETEQTTGPQINPERNMNQARCAWCGWKGYVYQCAKTKLALVACPDGGILREIYKVPEWGQVSMRTIPPGKAKPGHIHRRRDEMWVLVRGDNAWVTAGTVPGPITFQLLLWYPYRMQAGVGHAVENRGQDEAVILFWSSEVYDPEDPDREPWEPKGTE